MIRKYHNHKLQTTPWHREEEPLYQHETPVRQIKQSNQLSLQSVVFIFTEPHGAVGNVSDYRCICLTADPKFMSSEFHPGPVSPIHS